MPKNTALCSGNVYFISLKYFCFTALKYNRKWNPDCMGKIHVDFHETRICTEVLSNTHLHEGDHQPLSFNKLANEVASLLVGWRYTQGKSYSLHANMNFFINMVYHTVSFSKHSNKSFTVFYLLLFIFWRTCNKSLIHI